MSFVLFDSLWHVPTSMELHSVSKYYNLLLCLFSQCKCTCFLFIITWHIKPNIIVTNFRFMKCIVRKWNGAHWINVSRWVRWNDWWLYKKFQFFCLTHCDAYLLRGNCIRSLCNTTYGYDYSYYVNTLATYFL